MLTIGYLMKNITLADNLKLLAFYNNVNVSQPVSPLYNYIKQLPSGKYQIAATLVKGYKRVVARGSTTEDCYQAAVRFIHKYNIPYDY